MLVTIFMSLFLGIILVAVNLLYWLWILFRFLTFDHTAFQTANYKDFHPRYILEGFVRPWVDPMFDKKVWR